MNNSCMRTAAFAGIACLFSTSAVAWVLGSIDGANKNALALKIESLYAAVIAEGTIPVDFETVRRGDTVEAILRRKSSFEGQFFPVLLDSLTCDLNSAICRRDLSTAKAGGITTITNPLQLDETAGDWGRLTPGQQIIVPSLTISKNTVSRRIFKPSGISIDSLLANNEVCEHDLDLCLTMTDFMNYTNPDYRQDTFDGYIFVPSYDYIVTIPSTCDKGCATVNRNITVDLSGDRYIVAPYYIYTSVVNEQTGMVRSRIFTSDDYSGIAPLPPNGDFSPPRIDLGKIAEKGVGVAVDKAARDSRAAADKAANDLTKASEEAQKAAERAAHDASETAQKVAQDAQKALDKAAQDAQKAAERAAEDMEKAAERAGQEARRAAEMAAESLPKDLDEKIGTGRNILKDSVWGPIGKVNPFSDVQETPLSDVRETPPSEFGTDQAPVMARARFRATPSALYQKIRDKGARQTVMIIDSDFDKFHCEFAKAEFIVYDCTNKDQTFKNGCNESHSKFAYTNSNKTVAVANVTPSLPQASGDQVGGVCGPAGHMDVVQVEKTPEAIAPRHGTHLAGIIASRNDDNFGVSGVNPTARIVGVKVDMDNIDDQTYGLWLLARIKEIIFGHTVRVVDFSAGYKIQDSATANGEETVHRDWLTTLIDDYTDTVLFVVAAGNKPDPDCRIIPACLSGEAPNVVSVVALDSNFKPRANTSVNLRFTVGAEGEGILGPVPLDKYAKLDGSSQAAALVAGAVNLTMSLGSAMRWSPIKTKNRIIVCSDFKAMGDTDQMLGGSIDIDCLLHGDEHSFTVRNTAPAVVFSELAHLLTPNNILAYHDNNTDTDEKVDWADVVGFSRIPETESDVVLFIGNDGYQTKRLDRKFGSISGGQSVKVNTTDRPSYSLNLDEVDKFVRKTGE